MKNAELLAAVDRWALDTYGIHAERVTIRLRGVPEPASLPIVVEKATDGAPASAPDATVPRETTPTEDSIIEVLRTAEKPLKASTIAKRANRKFTNHFRKMVYQMRREGKLVVCDVSLYWLAERGEPPTETPHNAL